MKFMINQQILDYIKQQVQQGVSREQIKSSLITNGWQASDIEEGFNAIGSGSSGIPLAPTQPPFIPTSQKSYKKLLAISALVLIIIAGGILYYYKFISNTMVNTNKTNRGSELSQTIKLEPTQAGPFKYFQIGVSTGTGVSGEVYLNGNKVHDFSDEGSQTSNNEAQELIKDGENTIELKIMSVADATSRASFSDSVVDIALYALDVPADPNDENRVIHITWNPTTNSNRDLFYTFSISRSLSPDALKPNYDVSQAEKDQLIATIAKKKTLLSSKNVADIRAYYIKTMPADVGVATMTNTQILNLADLGLKGLNFPSSAIEDSTTEWAKVGDTIQAFVTYNGQDKLLSIKLIDGIWY